MVIITPATTTPEAIPINAYLTGTLSAIAESVAVQRPVSGRGIAVNRNNASAP